jgi:hypothetical protein
MLNFAPQRPVAGAAVIFYLATVAQEITDRLFGIPA